MPALLRDPVPPFRLALLALGLSAAVAIYCLVYTALAGRPETLSASLAWALVNVLPWIPALEAAKRARSAVGIAASLLGGLAASMGVGLLLQDASGGLWFEAWRRVPALAAAAALAVLVRFTGKRHAATRFNELPLLPRQIDWVRAARNYVEIRAGGRTIVHRAPLSEVERQLAEHGFVRIHRSMLVRRACIIRIRPDDVVLADGTHLPVGRRYRSAVDA